MDGNWMAMRSAMMRSEAPTGLRRGTIRRVSRFAKPYRLVLVIFLAVTVASSVIGVITPVLAGRVVDAIVAHRDLGLIITIAVGIAVLATVDALFGLAGRFYSARIGEGLIFDLRRTVYDHVQRLPVAFFTQTRTGALVSRLNNDVIGAQRALTSTLSGVVTNAIQLALALIVMFSLSWQITLAALVLLPVFVLPARRMGARMADLQRQASVQNAGMTTQMTERFSAPGATLVKLFGRPEAESAEFSTRAGNVRDLGIKTAMATRYFMTGLTLLPTFAQAVVYGVGGWLALSGDLPAGTVVTLALLLSRLYGPMTQLANSRVDVMVALVAFERVFEVLDLDPMIVERDHPRALPTGGISIEFDDVRFSYPSPSEIELKSLSEVAVADTRGGVEVLHGIDFHAEPGQLVALVGSSGAGKSTIAGLVPRLYDIDSGVVRLAGTDVRDLSFAAIRGAVGVVTQDGHLFHDTIAANLRYARPEATDAELWDSLRRARLSDLVAALPDGLDTVVGERGYRLSGGERQRLTIARLLLARPRVVILDEATAHLDSESEVAVQAALSEALDGRTALVIAHRLSTIRAADQILVVEHGRVIERGTHRDLLLREGRYAELYRTQFANDTAPATTNGAAAPGNPLAEPTAEPAAG